jgi:hypothetical protein
VPHRYSSLKAADVRAAASEDHARPAFAVLLVAVAIVNAVTIVNAVAIAV